MKDEPRKQAREKEVIQTIKTLFLEANPASTSRLAIDEETRAITQKVRAAIQRDVLTDRMVNHAGSCAELPPAD